MAVVICVTGPISRLRSIDPTTDLAVQRIRDLGRRLPVSTSIECQQLTNVRGKVMLMALGDAFKQAGVSIPFPHGNHHEDAC